ncbi:hypothetical protein [Pannonibacter phragmitetus]|uniref:hypothetical protein n=1 Tax=Pannonibacter phragmitetus TaxID=121719 RepID=UPI000AA6E3EA
MTADVEQGKAGTLFEDFLKEEGIHEEATEQAVKRVLAFQLAEAMKAQKISKVEMARRLQTSRSQLDRLLDPITTVSHSPFFPARRASSGGKSGWNWLKVLGFGAARQTDFILKSIRS